MRKQDLVLSGGFGTSTNSARAGFLPISLERAPIEAFESIPIYLRSTTNEKDEHAEAFNLYCAEHVRFSEAQRERLVSHGVRFIYIPMVHQSRFRQQTEACLQKVAEDPSVAVSVKSEIIYETSVELVNELLSEPDLIRQSGRLEKVSRAVTTLVLNDPTSFSHLFTASHHDFYTATHMVNVATWMVPLAYALGHHDVDELNHICQAGILHDIGKMQIPAEILNKSAKLSDDEWQQIRRHPEDGCEYLKQFGHIHPMVFTVTRQHHERLDGSGYPDKLVGDQIDPISRICAVVDSFDAMTAFRPFKQKTMSVAQAMDIIISETPLKYDPAVVDAWVNLLRAAGKQVDHEPSEPSNSKGRRRFPRFPINCPARAHVLDLDAEGPREEPGIPIIAHNLSRSGVGFLSQSSIAVGEHARIYLQGNGSLNKTMEGVIIRCRNYRDGWYEGGLELSAISAEEPDPILNAA
ncbi:MAG TPA: HD domain-containing phosphohydrolase [Tepidisphaeraceae bacterium]|nr:HD domain-containing phosphohydrolase [Tepidisphaeraceae bacterium]